MRKLRKKDHKWRLNKLAELNGFRNDIVPWDENENSESDEEHRKL